jgi:signal peptidase I
VASTEEKRFRIPNEIKYVIIAVIGIAIFWVGIRLVFGVNNPFYVVASESMVPRLKVGDLLLVQHGSISSPPSSYYYSSSFNNLKVGDIIVFRSPGVREDTGQPEVIVHRVAKIYTTYQGERIIRTKGDANSNSIYLIDYPITSNSYIGKVVLVIPGVGLAARAISPPVNYILIAVILVILFFLLVKRGRDQRKEEQTDSGSGSLTN